MVTPEQVLKLNRPTADFLCPLSSNIYRIDFLAFTISDFTTKNVFFHIDKEVTKKKIESAACLDERALRTIHYKLSADVLETDTVATKLIFSVGKKALKNFRLIERHFFRNECIKTYDFKFGFCIPNSTNTWEAVYSVPLLEKKLIREMISNPAETISDSFYFVDNKLVIHNKAEYTYIQRKQKVPRSVEEKEEKESKSRERVKKLEADV